MYDAAIIGAGPAGLSAALHLALHNKEIIWFGAASEKVAKSEKIANYPGLGLISGEELNRRFLAHAAQLELSPLDRRVTNIMPAGDSFMLLADNEMVEAKTLLLTTGASAGKGLPGEETLLGRGVSYCATCDGFLYKDKTIAVWCGSPRFEHEVLYLAELAQKVWLYTPYKGGAIDRPNIERVPEPVAAVEGEDRVSGIRLRSGSILPVDGVFCLRASVAPQTLLPGLEMDGAHIKTDRAMRTNIPGCFAAGDCTGRPYQIAKAVGEGNIAGHSMTDYLSQEETK